MSSRNVETETQAEAAPGQDARGRFTRGNRSAAARREVVGGKLAARSWRQAPADESERRWREGLRAALVRAGYSWPWADAQAARALTLRRFILHFDRLHDEDPAAWAAARGDILRIEADLEELLGRVEGRERHPRPRPPAADAALGDPLHHPPPAEDDARATSTAAGPSKRRRTRGA